MNITRDTVVRFDYVLKDSESNILEDSTSSEPMTYLHGHGNLLPGLENALEGKQEAEEVETTLAPSEAFGERQPDSEQRIPLKHLRGSKQWKPGMTAVVQTEQGQRQVTVVKVGHTMATVDTNHPLAGKTLTFSITIREVRAASEAELSHGHAHGPGGHHH